MKKAIQFSAVFAYWLGVLFLAPGICSAAALSFSALRLGTSGPDNNVFTYGQFVVPVAQVDSNVWYKVIVRSPSGTILNPSFTCTSGSAFSTNNNGYVIQPADPVSTSGPYTFTIEQFADNSCSVVVTSAVRQFYVVKTAASVDGFFSGETTNRFAVGQTAFVRVEGLPAGTPNWSVTWLTPNGSISCANTLGVDRPSVDVDGALPSSSSFLAYPPNSDSLADAWNKSANYDASSTCQALALTNQGTWNLRLQLNAASFVVLPVFLLSNDCAAPTLFLNPENQTVCAGSPVSFSVFATGTNLTYRWRRNGVNLSNGAGISGTAADTLSISAPAPANAGDYDVVIVGECGSITSAVATLTINLPSACSITGPTNVCANSSGNLFSAPPAMSGYLWQVFGGGTIAGPANQSNVAVNVTSPGTLTLSLTFTNSSGCATNCSRVVTISQPTASVSGGGVICLNGSASLQATLTGLRPWTVTWSDGVVQTNITNSVASRSVSPSNTTVYTLTLVRDAFGCAGTTAGSAAVTVNNVPMITTQPTNTGACVGGTVSFTAAASGVSPNGLQWQLSTNGGASFTNISGATNGTLTLSNLPLSSDGQLYRALFQNICGVAGSSNALLSVSAMPLCSINGNNPACGNAPNNLYFAPAGMASYAWSISGAGSSIAGSTNGQSVSVTTGTNNFTLTLRIVNSNGCASVCSSIFSNRIVRATVSGSATTCPGSPATIQAALTGIAPWTLIWSDGFTQTNILSSPATRVVSPASNVVYSVVAVSDASCAGTSSGSATITLSPLPVVTGNPTNRTVCSGATVSFFASANVANVRWQVSSDGGAHYTNIAGATSTNYTLVTTPADDGKRFRAIFTNSCGDTVSGVAVLTVNATPRPVLDINQAVCASSVGNMATVTNASAGSTFAWTITGGTITAGAGTSNITYSANASGNVVIGVTVTSAAGCVGSTNRTLPIVTSGTMQADFWANAQIPANWTVFNLNDANQNYSEGSVIPMRMTIRNLCSGSAWCVTITYDFEQGGKHFMDSITTYNANESSVNGFECSGTVCGTATTYPIPTDATLPAGAQIPGDFTVYNGVVTNVSAYSGTGNTRSITVYGVAAGGGGAKDVVLLVGGHLSRENEWGLNNAASSVSGGSQGVSFNSSCNGGANTIKMNPGTLVHLSDLKISKSSSPNPVCLSNLLTYTLDITNLGPELASSIVVTDSLPRGVVFSSALLSQGTFTGTSNLSFSLGSLPAGSNAVIQIIVLVTNTAPDAVTNIARIISSSPTDPAPGNNSSTNITAVNRQLAFAMQPQSIGLCPDGTANFSVIATGSPPISYQWYRSGAGGLIGATNSSLSITGMTFGDVGSYYAVATGPCNFSTSSVAVLTVATNTSVAPLTPLVLCPGATATFTAAPSGTAPFSFVWRKDGVLLVDATNSVLTISPVSATNTGTYTVEVTGGCRNATNSATLTVNPPTTATPLANQNACPSNNVTFATVASGVGPFTYQWLHQGTNIIGATSNTLALLNVTTNDAGTYTVIVSGLCNAVTNSATLSLNASGSATPLVSLVKCPGNTATFFTDVTGTGPFQFTWRKDGNVLVGETNNSLTLTNLVLTNAGVYSVEVQGACNGAGSSATLVMNTNTTATPLINSAACPGSNAVFSTVIEGTGPFAILWRKDGVEIPGQTNTSLALSNVTVSDDGVYSVEITGECNSVTNSATFTVSEQPVLTPLLNVTSCPGSSVTFSTVVSGTGPFAFLWRSNGVELPGVTSNVLVLTNISAASAATYSVEVISACGAATNSATLTLNDLTTASPLSDQAVCAGFPATFTTVPGGTGPFSFVWRRNGQLLPGETNAMLSIPILTTNDAGDYAVEVYGACNSVTNHATLNVNALTTATPVNGATICAGDSVTLSTIPGGTGPFSFAWRRNGQPIANATNASLVLSNTLATDSGTYSVEVTGLCNSVTNTATLTVRTLVSITPMSDVTRCIGTSLSFAPLVSGTGPFTFAWRKDGVLLAETNATLSLAPVTGTDAGVYTVEVTGPCNSATNTAALAVNELTVTTPLANISVCPGGNATFSTVPNGAGPFTFKWRHDGVLIAGATNDTLIIPAVTNGFLGVYSVEVSGACNTVTNSASLSFNAATTATPLTNLVHCAGDTAVFSTVPNGTGPFSFVWRRNGALLVDETNSSLVLTAVAPAIGGLYTVEVYGACNSVTNSAQLIISDQVSATSLTNATRCVGESVTFVTVTTGGGLAFVWKRNGEVLIGQTNASVTISPVRVEDGGIYTVEVSTSCSSVTNQATLTVLASTVATPLSSLTRCLGSVAQFTTAPGGAGPFQFVWRKNGVLLVNETNSTLSVSVTATNVAGTYSVEVTGFCNSVTNTATLTVNEPATAGALPSEIICAGSTYIFAAVPGGSGPFAYQWRRSGTLLSFATNSVLQLTNVSPADTGVYSVEITGACNTATNSGTLTVSTQPTATPMTNQTRCTTDNVTFSTVVGGIGPFTFVWRKGSTVIPGEFTSSLTLTNLRTADAGTYSVEITGGCGTLTNSTALTVLTRVTAAPLANQNRCLGANATFSTLASGTGPFTYVWRKDGVLLPGRTNSNTTITNLGSADAGIYSAEITGQCNTFTNTSTLTISAIPTVSGLTNQIVCPGVNAVLNADVSGANNFTYVWRRNGFVLVGQNTNTLLVTSMNSSKTGTYSLEVSSICRSVTNSATLNLKTNVSIAVMPNQTQCEGRSVTFTANVVGTGPLTFQWQKDNTNIVNATNSSYTIPITTLAHSGTYTVRVSGDCNATNASVVLTVTPGTTATPLQDVTVCEGGFAQFSTLVSGGGAPYQFVWRRNGTLLPGQTNSSIQFSNVLPVNSGVYSVEITGCVTITNSALLTVRELVRASMETNKIACSCSDMILGPVVTGTGPFTYVWRKNGVLLVGETNISLNLGKLITTSPGVYQVEITGACNTATNKTTVELFQQVGGQYSQLLPIGIQAFGPASIYPSRVFVQCAPHTVNELSVTLYGLSHTYPDDINILLVSPTGRAVKLMSDAGGGNDHILTGVDLTFTDGATFKLPDNGLITSGEYKPTDYPSADEPSGDNFPAPAIAANATTIGELLTTDPNGYWSLYIVNDHGSDSGSLAGGWRLNFGRRDYILLNVSLTEPELLPGGGFQMQLSGEPNSTYYLEASSNLQTWDVIQTNKLQGITMPVTDTTAPQHNYRFYRVSGCRE